jgi:hypothetical protein
VPAGGAAFQLEQGAAGGHRHAGLLQLRTVKRTPGLDPVAGITHLQGLDRQRTRPGAGLSWITAPGADSSTSTPRCSSAASTVRQKLRLSITSGAADNTGSAGSSAQANCTGSRSNCPGGSGAATTPSAIRSATAGTGKVFSNTPAVAAQAPLLAPARASAIINRVFIAWLLTGSRRHAGWCPG